MLVAISLRSSSSPHGRPDYQLESTSKFKNSSGHLRPFYTTLGPLTKASRWHAGDRPTKLFAYCWYPVISTPREKSEAKQRRSATWPLGAPAHDYLRYWEEMNHWLGSTLHSWL
jgi:hypothetical protein